MEYSCCIEMLFCELPFLDRIEAAREAGFTFVEFWTWEDKDIPAIADKLNHTGMKVSIFQGNTQGRMVDPADGERYIQGVVKSLPAAKALECKTLFLMSDLLREDRSVLPSEHPLSDKQKRTATLDVLHQLAEIGEAEGITFVIEPLNTTVDHMGYSLCHSRDAFEIVRLLGSPFVRVLYDAYHMQIMEGNIIESIRAGVDTFGHFHIADVPGRMEPGTGELNYKNILQALRDAGYSKAVGFEFSPSSGNSRTTLQCTFQRVEQGSEFNG